MPEITSLNIVILYATEESWKLTVTATDIIRQQLQFTVHGSLTGGDGEGRSDSVFTSRSGTFRIQPEWWFRRKSPTDFAQFRWLKSGDILHWEVKPLCYDRIVPVPGTTMTIAQGFEKGLHHLQLSGKSLI